MDKQIKSRTGTADREAEGYWRTIWRGWSILASPFQQVFASGAVADLPKTRVAKLRSQPQLILFAIAFEGTAPAANWPVIIPIWKFSIGELFPPRTSTTVVSLGQCLSEIHGRSAAVAEGGATEVRAEVRARAHAASSSILLRK